MEKCDECNKGKLHKKEVDYVLLGENLGKYEDLVCDNCQETIFSGDSFDLIEKKAKEKGLWRIDSKTRIDTSAFL